MKMSDCKSVLGSKPLNILVLGRQNIGKSLFITRFEDFWRIIQGGYNKCPSERRGAKEITKYQLSVFGEKLQFLDTRGICSGENICNIITYITVGDNCNQSIDVILVIIEEDLDITTSYLQYYLKNVLNKLSTFPNENFIFITLCEDDVQFNRQKFIKKLQKFLQEMSSTITVTLDKNVFVLQRDTIFVKNRDGKTYEVAILNDGKFFCKKLLTYMQNLDKPKHFKFHLTMKSILHIIGHMFNTLIELLFCIEKTLQQEPQTNKTSIMGILQPGFIYCRNCSSKEGKLKICHDSDRHSNCNIQENKDAVKCSLFVVLTKACRKCYCPISEHGYSTFFSIPNGYKILKETCNFEKNIIINLIATFFIFCEQNCNELPKYCNYLKNKSYWSTVKLKYISDDDAIFKEINEKIKELQADCYKPTVEEITLCINEIITYKLCCLNSDETCLSYIDCVLEFNVSTNADESQYDALKNSPPGPTTISKADNVENTSGTNKKCNNLPEMKTDSHLQTQKYKNIDTEIDGIKSRLCLVERNVGIGSNKEAECKCFKEDKEINWNIKL